MRQPIVTLTTDFGLADHFVGAMKGVILGLAPRARIVDITHQIAPFAISEAAFVAAEAFRWFPPGVVHVVVVDPGVGTSRRPILAEAAGHYFVAPDNGVLSLVLARTKHKVRAVTAEKYFLHPVSRTFHGRDVFAPVAARLALGVAPARFGKLISDYVRGGFEQPVASGKDQWTGVVLKVDRFGNLITNFSVVGFDAMGTRPFELCAGRRRITTRAQSYADGKPGQLLLVAGSAGYFEIATNQGSAARLTGRAAGAEVTLVLR
jgi:hypothetical protein